MLPPLILAFLLGSIGDVLVNVISNIRGLLFSRRCQSREIMGTRTKWVLQYWKSDRLSWVSTVT